ncbi:MAG: membrane protein insertion efficiency factor YidD [Phycisphaerales bacterium]|nr:MAG: membrane protein insertion efficiency factor YidD [Phycisphaerales bacterium]
MGGSLQFGQGPRTSATQSVRRFVVFVLVFTIRCYQASLRPLLFGSCKFCPTCSEYAIEALQTHGLGRGLALAVRRLARCHPFSPGGIDPVPDPTHSPSSGRPD